MTMRVLLVEDDPKVVELVESTLLEHGHAVDVAGNGEDGLRRVTSDSYDVVVLDIGLPDLSGRQVTRSIRAQGLECPILILTGLNTTADVVASLDAGADDYVTKPFNERVLEARLRALVRRFGRSADGVLHFADLELDQLGSEVRRDGKRIRLTPTEFRLLRALLLQGEEVSDRSYLLRRVWGIDFDPGTNTLDVHMSHLRRKLESGGRSRLIQTIEGIGFRMGVGEGGADRP